MLAPALQQQVMEFAICIDCKYAAPRTGRRKCSACQSRYQRNGGDLLNQDREGGILCMCGCQKEAEQAYLAQECYERERENLQHGQPSLLQTCPVRYDLERIKKVVDKPRPCPSNELEFLDRDPKTGYVIPDYMMVCAFADGLAALSRMRGI